MATISSHPPVTFYAHGGETHHDWIMLDGTKAHGPNEPDQSIVAACRHYDDDQLIDYLTTNRLTPTMVARAFNACGLDGVRSVLDGVKRSPELAAWYATQPELVVMPLVIPTPERNTDLATEGRMLLNSMRDYVQRVEERLGA